MATKCGPGEEKKEKGMSSKALPKGSAKAALKNKIASMYVSMKSKGK